MSLMMLSLTVGDSMAAITFNLQQQMDFGTLISPSSRERNTIRPNGNITFESTILKGTPVPAHFTISGATNGNATVTVENLVSGDNMLTFRNPRGRFNNRNVRFPWALDSSFQGDNRDFYIGARLVVRSNVRNEAHNMQYDIVVTYE